MENESIIFIDSNYWIYLFDQTTPEHKAVKNHFRDMYKINKIAVNAVVMMEVMHYLVKHLGPEMAKKKWNIFTSITMDVGSIGQIELDNMFEVLMKYSFTGIGSRDASILSYMKINKINYIATHDKDFKKIDFLTVIDPILT